MPAATRAAETVDTLEPSEPRMRLRDRKSGAGVLGDITNHTSDPSNAVDVAAKTTRVTRRKSNGAKDVINATVEEAEGVSVVTRRRRSSGANSTANGDNTEVDSAPAPMQPAKRARRSTGGQATATATTAAAAASTTTTATVDENVPPAPVVPDVVDLTAASYVQPEQLQQQRQQVPSVAPPAPPVSESNPARGVTVTAAAAAVAAPAARSAEVAHPQSVADVAQVSSGSFNATSDKPFHMPNPRGRKLPLQLKAADPAKCMDRIDDMYELYYEQESLYSARPYMDQQQDINRKMRSILVDWLVDVHHRFKLQPLTLWLTVNILDRYLMKVQTMRSKLQLVGVSAMFIAGKYEEMFPPYLRDCVTITDFAYEREDVLAMEKQILVTLNYNIFVPTGFHFLTRYLSAINASEHLCNLASYYAERNLQEYDSLSREPHMVAAACLFAAIEQQEESLGRWTADHTEMWRHLEIETGYRADQLLSYAKILVQHVSEEPETASKRRLLACKKKFSCPKYMCVSNLPLPMFPTAEEAQMRSAQFGA